MTKYHRRANIANELIKYLVNVQITHLDIKSATLQDLVDSENSLTPQVKAVEDALQTSSVYKRSSHRPLPVYKKIIGGSGEHESLFSDPFGQGSQGSRARSRSNFLLHISL